MEVSFLTTTLAGVFITWAGLVASVVMFLRVPGMKWAIEIPGMPRIWFLSLITLKLWVATFLGYISVGTIVGGLPFPVRRIQRKERGARIPGRRPPRREGGIEDD
jgi:hypothetical protein